MRHIKLAIAPAILLGLSATQARTQLVIVPTFESTWSANIVGTSHSNHVAQLTQITGRI